MDLFEMDLGPLGAPGFTLGDRLDMTGHPSGRVDPHINTDILCQNGSVASRVGNADFRDLAHNQVAGSNRMQNGWTGENSGV